MSVEPGSHVVTGGSTGIGLAIARRLAVRGPVVAVSRQQGAPMDRKVDASIVTVIGDVTDPGVLERAMDRAVDLAPLRGWVNNAVAYDSWRLVDTDPERLRALLRVNLEATVLGTALAARRFLEQGTGGSIVTISSLQARLGFPGWSGYAAAKGAIEAVTRTAAVELAPSGIRVNAVAPGTVATERFKDAVDRHGAAGQAAEAAWAAIHPIGRVATPDEIAAVVAFLISPDAAYLTGQVIAVDGGASVYGRSPVGGDGA